MLKIELIRGYVQTVMAYVHGDTSDVQVVPKFGIKNVILYFYQIIMLHTLNQPLNK